MALVLTLLRAHHAHGTHHQLALDALDRLAPEAWRRLFYKHITLYLDGAKAPDKAFKDFQNHVLHARDGFWGGAVEQAGTWYRETVTALARQDWAAAAYAAGVLSHYVTDPLMPLHTHQSAAENNLHAAIEWSAAKSYARLRAIGLAMGDASPLPARGSADWLGDLMRSGATAATAHYETLLAHYDIKRGVVVPEEGFDEVGARAVAGQLVRAERLFGVVLAAAIAEANVSPPEVALAGDALQAFLTMPKAWWKKRGLDADDRRVVEAMYDELMATGAVRATLREDERCIQELYAAHRAAQADLRSSNTTASEPQSARPAKAAAPPPPSARDEKDGDPVEAGDGSIVIGARLPVETPRPAPRPTVAPAIRTAALAREAAAPVAREADDASAPASAQAHSEPPKQTVSAEVVASSDDETRAMGAPPQSAVGTPVLSAYRPMGRSAPRPRLATENDIVDAPSIGPKTAQRLNAVGIDTVGDFLKAHPIALESRLETRHITADVLAAWQDQTRLMLSLPDLTGTQAQLLVGAGYRTVDALAQGDGDKLCADILSFAVTTDGQRILREGGAPDVETIRTWAEAARATKAA